MHDRVEQRHRYERDGYLVVEQLVERSTAERLCQLLCSELGVELTADAGYDAAFDNVWRSIPWLSDLHLHREIGAVAATLANVSPLRLYHDAMFVNKAAPWHQDESSSLVDTLISAWMPLVPMSRATGSITYARGSHVRGLTNQNDQDDRSLEEDLVRSGFAIQETRMVPGDVVFHHGMTFHRADPATDRVPQIALAMFFFPDGNRLRPDPFGMAIDIEHQHEFFPSRAIGDVADSALNPIVYSKGIT
jgi:ectoine hydroxylase-related dioxygenase (phytanoyl-CoA dioxygenase family)